MIEMGNAPLNNWAVLHDVHSSVAILFLHCILLVMLFICLHLGLYETKFGSIVHSVYGKFEVKTNSPSFIIWPYNFILLF